eukprot:TRINITY_DN45178_c0_g1_i4.p1 TRINITY_DN45178_c0_g1~~TRINITY_DN45178_c0_g1_i4.p1  ORF type:complete len:447 (-),score=115.49 TRINITY_DN45178_c0_g1_i4:405-1745(-)
MAETSGGQTAASRLSQNGAAPPVALRLHELQVDCSLGDRTRPTLTVAAPESFVEDLRQLTLAVLWCPEAFAAPVRRLLETGPRQLAKLREAEEAGPSKSEWLKQEAEEELALSAVYKREGDLKERVQLRRCGGRRPTAAARPGGVKGSGSGEASESGDGSLVPILADAVDALEDVSQACLDAWCEHGGVLSKSPKTAAGCQKTAAASQDLLREVGDYHFFEPDSSRSAASSAKSKSVLNLIQYFNDSSCSEEPCREHADPGLLTILCRSSHPEGGLQVRFPQMHGGSQDAGSSGRAYCERWRPPGEAVSYADEWQSLEPLMDELARQKAGEDGGMVLLAIVDETLERLSNWRFPACRHRVSPQHGLRSNITYEMRPRVNVWTPWPLTTRRCPKSSGTADDQGAASCRGSLREAAASGTTAVALAAAVAAADELAVALESYHLRVSG